MTTLDEIKKNWDKNTACISSQTYDQASLQKNYKSRVNKHLRVSMQYFWASLGLQILVYALLSHMIVKHWADPQTLLFSLAGVLLYIPFTVVLMKKFKRMAITLPKEGHSGVALFDYVQEQHDLLSGFYKFKRRYELILIPLSAAIGVMLVFNLYVPGGVFQHVSGALTMFTITLVSCAMAIYSENKKSFQRPLRQLKELLTEFKS